jgi:hypothetical protein
MATRFVDILPRVGLSDYSQVTTGTSWQLWAAVQEGTFAAQKILILYFDGKVNTFDTVRQASNAASRHIRGATPLYVIVRDNARIANDLPEVARLCGAKSARTYSELLRDTLPRRLRPKANPHSYESEAERVFVDPDIRLAGDLTPQKAIPTLSAWLTTWVNEEESPAASLRLAVLLAPAGAGKTTLSQNLFHRLAIGHVPLLIQPAQWASMLMREQLSLWDLFRESLDSLYESILSREDVELCLQNRLFIPIFDGFDELHTVMGLGSRATDILDELADLFADSDGRVLLTSRDSFWAEHVPSDRSATIQQFELLQFDKTQRDNYLQQRFVEPTDIPKREAAAKVLQRLDDAAHGAAATPFRKRITSMPLLVALVAESVDTPDIETSLQKYGDLLESSDPLDGIVLMLCERERERRGLKVPAATQRDLFSLLAFEYGMQIPQDALEFYADVPELSQRQALTTHALLQRSADHLTFRFPFLADYLASRILVERLELEHPPQDLLKALSQQAAGGSNLLERVVHRLVLTHPDDWQQLLQTAKRTIDQGGSDGAQSGCLHIILEAVRSTIPLRKERGDLVRSILDIGHGDPIGNLYVQGVITGLDLTDTRWQDCRFRNSGFRSCIFDQETTFARCLIDGGFDVEDCDDFSSVIFEANCTLSLRAREVIQAHQGRTGSRRVTTDQIVESVRIALEKFRRGVGFKSITVQGSKRGRLAKSPIAGSVWDALVRHGVLETIVISGTPDGGLMIADGKTSEVRNFLNNAVLTGSLRTAVRALEAEFDIVK